MNGHFIVVCSACGKIVDQCICAPSLWCRNIVRCMCGGCNATNELIITNQQLQLVELQNRIDAIKNDIRGSILLPVLIPLGVLNLLNGALLK